MYDHVHYDRTKDNIFEIPETYYMWESGNRMQYEKFYFIQYKLNLKIIFFKKNKLFNKVFIL